VSNDTTGQSVLFPDLFKKPVIVQFDQPDASNDGGAILLKACDERIGLSERLAKRIVDTRQPGKVAHSIQDLVRQRIYSIACGYADCNDAAKLAGDPIQKMLIGRDPTNGLDLASQPTLSRFENSVTRADIYRMGKELMETVVEHQRERLGRRKVSKIAIDLDPTDDPTHGQQEFTFFNSHYDTWCYLPVVGFLRFNDEEDQYLFAAVLRAGNAPANQGAIGILSRVIDVLKENFSRARILVRLDGGFAGPELLNFLDDEAKVDYVIGLGKNSVLKRRAKRLMGKARRISKRRGETANVFGETRYAAGTWKKRKRRVIIKAEVVRQDGKAPKDNERFVVTNLKGSPRHIYKKIYCYRGDIENRIKELHHGLEIDRTSCCDFLANQFRVLLTAAAFVLFQELRIRAGKGDLARAQVTTLREHLLKLGAWVERSVRRIVIHLPESFPHIDDWRRIARSLGASTA
jgi:hypothetical protein